MLKEECCYLRFARYIREYLLPALDKDDIIVMDNASYHSVLDDRIPTKSSKKDAMREWLDAKGYKFIKT